MNNEKRTKTGQTLKEVESLALTLETIINEFLFS